MPSPAEPLEQAYDLLLQLAAGHKTAATTHQTSVDYWRGRSLAAEAQLSRITTLLQDLLSRQVSANDGVTLLTSAERDGEVKMPDAGLPSDVVNDTDDLAYMKISMQHIAGA